MTTTDETTMNGLLLRGQPWHGAKKPRHTT